MDCTPEIVRSRRRRRRRFAPHFHLPLQHASDRVLAAMRRPYTIEYYAALVDDIRARMPHASIGSDIIVGFPGETDDDFEQLVVVSRALAADAPARVPVFRSARAPTASTMPDKVQGAVVRERGRRVREIGGELTARFRDRRSGPTHRALTLEDGSLVVTGNYLKLRIPPGLPRNEWVMCGSR